MKAQRPKQRGQIWLSARRGDDAAVATGEAGGIADGIPCQYNHKGMRTVHYAIKTVPVSRSERLEAETDLFGFVLTGNPLELFPDIARDTCCPVNRLAEFVGQKVQVCGLVVEQRIHNQATGEPMKFLSLADWTGIVETELFAQTYKTYGLATLSGS